MEDKANKDKSAGRAAGRSILTFKLLTAETKAYVSSAHILRK